MFEGLNNKTVIEQRQKYGFNEIVENKGLVWPKIFFSQFKSSIVYTILAVVIISLLLGEASDAILASVVLFLNIIMGFYQEYKAEKTFKALKNLIKPIATVIRDSVRFKISAREIVPEDVVVISSGDKIPADGMIINNASLLVNEAILTGEQEPVEKTTDKDKNMVYMGTTVVSGRGIFIVKKTGIETRFGKISQSLLDIKDAPTDLQKKLTKFSKSLTIIILLICTVIFITGLIYGEDVWQMLRLSIILAIAAIPEGLPIAVTIILALGMKRILKRQGLVKRLVSIETLGATTVICTDKTGTLTEGVMKVEKYDFKDYEEAINSIIFNNEQKSGVEIALWDYVKNVDKKDPYEMIENSKKIFEIPFDSKRKYSYSIIENNKKKTAYVLGAPEIVLGFTNLSEKEKLKEINKIEVWAKEGLRIIGIGYKKTGNLKDKSDFIFLGLVGVKDPIRKSVHDSVVLARKSGIEVKIITGDYRLTAENVGAQIGLKVNNENVLEGWEIDKLNDDELKEHVKNINVFARVSPDNKYRIVKALQDNGEIVAMTGDGVNDAPALKMADIGMVVGEATDVAKETADLVLLDSNFKTIVSAVEEGRLIFMNIKKVIAYILTNQFSEIILIFGAILLKLPAPLTIVQILTIHLVCDGPPDIILGFDTMKDGLMEMRPEEMKKEKILSNSVKFIVSSVSLVVGVVCLLVFYILKDNLELAQTVCFTSIGFISMINIFSFRNLNKSVFNIKNFFSNYYLFLSILYGLTVILIAVYVPFFNKILGTTPLSFVNWLIVFSMGILAVLIIEIAKLADRKHFFK